MTDTIGELMRVAGRWNSDLVAFTKGEESRTYSELMSRSSRLANGMRALGLETGDRVAVIGEDQIETVEAHLACVLGGFVSIVVNAKAKAREVDHILADSDARLILHTSGPQVHETLHRLGAEDVGRVALAGEATRARDTTFDQIVASASDRLDDVDRGPEDVAIIGYTSGTTGAPKGAMISSRAVAAMARTGAPVAFRLPQRGRVALTGSLSFAALFCCHIFPSLYMGSTIRLMGGVDFDEWFHVLRTERSTFTYTPSPLMDEFSRRIVAEPGRLPALTTILHGASPASDESTRAMVDAVGTRYVNGWGLTETSGPITSTAPGDLVGDTVAPSLSTVGRALPIFQLTARNEEGAVLPPGEHGELCAEGDSVFSGYLNDLAKTDGAFFGKAFRTGDLGHMDEEGRGYITARKSDVIISGGINIYPAELELTLERMPGVRAVAILGMPDERYGEAVTAVVVADPSAELVADDVTAYVSERHATFKKPRKVIFVDELPRSASMKVQKAVLRDSLLDASHVGNAEQGDR